MKKTLVIVPLIVVVSGGYVLYNWFQSPNTTVLKPTANDAGLVLASETGLKPWQTNLFTTRQPNYLQLKTSSESQGSTILASYLLTSRSSQQADQIGITIGKLNNNTLRDSSAVRLRLSQPAVYKVAQTAFAPAGALAFQRTDGAYETSVFWQHNTTYVAVVASGTAQRQAELEATLQAIVSNWQWR